MTSKRSKEGELVIDHRASPGLPPDFYSKIGLIGPQSLGGQVRSLPTFMCCHCGNHYIMNELRTRPRNHCRKCDAYVCDSPVCNLECKPFSQVLDELEKKIRHEESLKG